MQLIYYPSFIWIKLKFHLNHIKSRFVRKVNLCTSILISQNLNYIWRADISTDDSYIQYIHSRQQNYDVMLLELQKNVFLTLQKVKVQFLSSVRWCQRVQLQFFLSFKESKAFAIQELSLKSNEALPGWIQNTWATCLLQLFNASIMELKTCKVFNHQFIYISTFWYFVIILLKNICNIVEIYHLRPQ